MERSTSYEILNMVQFSNNFLSMKVTIHNIKTGIMKYKIKQKKVSFLYYTMHSLHLHVITHTCA